MPTLKSTDNPISVVGLYLGPLIAAAILLIGPPESVLQGAGAFPNSWIVLALLVLMAIWWVTEAIPIPVTALLPILVLPLAGINTISEVTTTYMHPIVVLLLGGFIFAKAIERWGLHERIALNIVARAGDRPAQLVGGFMFASAAMSMWISNSATSIMMMPIALSVSASLAIGSNKQRVGFRDALVLGVAFACSIGGLGTPIGTPTNLIVIGYLNEHSGLNIDFLTWLMIGLPVVIALLPITWLLLTRFVFEMPVGRADAANTELNKRIESLGSISVAEKRVLIVFVFIAAMWILRRPLNNLSIGMGSGSFVPFAMLTDHMIAIFAVVLCFIVPSGSDRSNSEGRSGRPTLLDWKSAERIPWGVLLLFGGGMSLAQGISSSGLSVYLGESLAMLADWPAPLLVFTICATVLALTEVTSNIATASALMPVLGAMALTTGLPIEVITVPVALAASCAFALPMATGPNAVAFATNTITMRRMAATGVWINLAALFIVSLSGYLLIPLVF